MKENKRKTGHTGKENASGQPAHSRFLALALGRVAVGSLVVLLSLSAACGTGGQEAQAGPVISDAEAGGIVLTAVTMGISSGHLALRRSSTPAVQALARAMIDDNIALDMQALGLLKKLSLEPVAGLASSEMERQAKEGLSNLVTTEHRDFDRGYLAQEIAHRRGFLRMLDETLIPSAGDGEIKLMLVRVRWSVKTHLERAEAIAASLDT